MGIVLPQLFSEKMKKLLLDQEYEAFMASYERPRKYGLRVNGLKLKAEAFAALSPMGARLTPVPWADSAFYYEEGDRPGKHRHYHAGLYYIQEPSAMVPVELLGVQPGDRVLDLCAAPGGKSTQLADKLQGQGVLVTNDNARERTKVLAKNIELAGVRNAIILNEEPAALAKVFVGWFDRILVDAPCSGEGMFRKDESMIAEWERHSVDRCSRMQRDILMHAAQMLAPGGTMVYSTCTFSPEENEAQILALLKRCPELEVLPVTLAHGWAQGRPEWAALSAADNEQEYPEMDGELANISGLALNVLMDASRQASIAGTVRLWPHLTEGEGHFAAVLRKRAVPVADNEQHPEVACSGSEAAEFRSGADTERFTPSGSDFGRSVSERVDGERSGGARERGRGERARGQALRAEPERREAGRRGRAPLHRTAAARGAEGAGPVEAWREFAAKQLIGAEKWAGALIAYGSRVYLQPAGVPPLDGLRVVRAGWYLGEAGPHRFEPSQALAMGLRAEEALLSLSFRSDDEETLRYLKGETLHIDASCIVRSSEAAASAETGGGQGRKADRSATKGSSAKGYVLVCEDGYPIGWGKYSGDGLLKNELAAGWRWM